MTCLHVKNIINVLVTCEGVVDTQERIMAAYAIRNIWNRRAMVIWKEFLLLLSKLLYKQPTAMVLKFNASWMYRKWNITGWKRKPQIHGAIFNSVAPDDPHEWILGIFLLVLDELMTCTTIESLSIVQIRTNFYVGQCIMNHHHCIYVDHGPPNLRVWTKDK